MASLAFHVRVALYVSKCKCCFDDSASDRWPVEVAPTTGSFGPAHLFCHAHAGVAVSSAALHTHTHTHTLDVHLMKHPKFLHGLMKHPVQVEEKGVIFVDFSMSTQNLITFV